ncbi:MAG: TlpA family protein disulfide reductase [Comamonadaceae bacterium]|nr:MAG: TlpA family protein disulfide reductase [Comamonadaceae bacterium]
MTSSSSPNPASEHTPAPVGVSTRSRRRWLMAGVGGLAAAGGAGFAWWRLQPHEVMTGAEEAWWNASFNDLSGAPVAVQRFKGKPLVLNFWATWCPPCVEELPLLNSFYKERAAQGWQVVGLAIDQPSAVRKFLERLPLDFPVALGGLTGTDLGRSLGNLTGGLPFTVLFGADGRILHRKMGQVTADDLQQWAKLA